MKRMILAATAAIALVFAGCEQEYNGPSAEEIANATKGKVPSVEEIANATSDATVGKENTQSIAAAHQQVVSDLSDYGEVTVVKKLEAYGQTDAAYTLTFNSASSSNSISLPSNLEWETPSTPLDGDFTLTLSNGSGSLKVKKGSISSTRPPVIPFTYTLDGTQKITGTLTVTTIYSEEQAAEQADVASVRNYFENSLFSYYYSNVDTSDLTATTPISAWGQTDVAYTITKSIGEFELYLHKSLDSDEKLEWKANSNPTANVNSSGYSSNYSRYTISNYSSTPKSASFTFKIVNSQDAKKTIQGTVTVNVSYSSSAADAQYLKSIQDSFTSFSNNSNVALFYADTPVTDWGQATAAKYTATVRYSGSDYLYLNLYNSNVNWTVPEMLPAGIEEVNSSYIRFTSDSSSVLANSTPVTLSFTGYGYSSGKSVSGTLELTIIR